MDSHGAFVPLAVNILVVLIGVSVFYLWRRVVMRRVKFLSIMADTEKGVSSGEIQSNIVWIVISVILMLGFFYVLGMIRGNILMERLEVENPIVAQEQKELKELEPINVIEIEKKREERREERKDKLLDKEEGRKKSEEYLNKLLEERGFKTSETKEKK